MCFQCDWKQENVARSSDVTANVKNDKTKTVITKKQPHLMYQEQKSEKVNTK